MTTKLYEQFKPQIDAYASALRHIYCQPVSAYLYPTALGQLIEINKS